MTSYVKKIIAKAERRIEARNYNQKVHEHSVRYKFDPLSEHELDDRFKSIEVSDSVKIAVCQGIISDYCNEKCTDTDINILETAVNIIMSQTVNEFDGKKKLIKFYRDDLPIRFSARKLRMFYHMIESDTPCEHINGYRECMNMLATWQVIYGRQWEGEPYEIDHIIPISLGSDRNEIRSLNNLDNLCMLYPKHNKQKGNKFPNLIYYKLKGISCANPKT